MKRTVLLLSMLLSAAVYITSAYGAEPKPPIIVDDGWLLELELCRSQIDGDDDFVISDEDSIECCSVAYGYCIWCPSVVEKCIKTPYPEDNPFIGLRPQSVDPGTVLAPTDDVPSPRPPTTTAGTSMAPKDMLPVINACFAASDQRTQVSTPNLTRVQCCSRDLGYCVRFRQDGKGAYVQTPYSREWPGRIDGIVPEVAAPRQQTYAPSN